MYNSGETLDCEKLWKFLLDMGGEGCEYCCDSEFMSFIWRHEGKRYGNSIELKELGNKKIVKRFIIDIVALIQLKLHKNPKQKWDDDVCDIIDNL